MKATPLIIGRAMLLTTLTAQDIFDVFSSTKNRNLNSQQFDKAQSIPRKTLLRSPNSPLVLDFNPP